jgi:hypothetical protein
LAASSFSNPIKAAGLGDTALPLAIGGEFMLPLQFELEFQPRDLMLERFVLGHQVRDRLSRGIQLTVQEVDGATAGVGDMDHGPQRRAAQMWAMLQLRAGEFAVRVKAEVHARSSLNAGNLASFIRPG